ncbi:hypothetical protein FRUB_02967 [Fimbriiglobus ruber]|uniref:DUF1559 domain-containing protein n=1 Tax=Fimbriiglobus ruber TaxID=1908690 RepID=A0A225DXV4_9BACT|nr:hypothetical protein FRUB_02967 [Fimbriiglobus ruber]
MTIAGVVVVLVFAYWFVGGFSQNRDTGMRGRSKNNLKQIGLGFHNWNEVFSRLPTPYAQLPDGTPLLADPTKRLSWRVSLLPFIDQGNLYKQFKLDEAWDGPINGPLGRTRVSVYSDGVRSDPSGDQTPYRVFVGGGALFDENQPIALADVTDGLSNTIMTIEAGETVPWAQYNELPFDPAASLPPLGGSFRDVILVGMADGSVREVKKSVDPQVLKAAITARGGESLPWRW